MAFKLPDDAITKETEGGAGAAQPETVDQPLSWAERGRLTGAGAAFNFADEIIGLVRGVASGDLTIDEAIDEERKLLEIARSKTGSLKYELGGAFLPGLLTVPFTGGAGLPATLLRAAAIGSGQAAVAAIGEQKGDLVERVTENPATVLGAATLGAVAGPLGQKAVKAAGALAAPARRLSAWLTSKAGGKLPTHIEAEVMRVIQEGGMTIDEVVERVGQGEIIPDMSEQAANALRAIYARSGKGAQVISETIKRRSETLRRRASETLKEDLAPVATTPNVTRAVNETMKELQAAESAAYNKLFKESGVITEEVNAAIEEILNINPSLRREITQHIQLSKLPPLFKIVKGEAQMLRTADLETAEVLRRVLMDGTKQGGAKGNLFRNLERQLRNQIDEFSPELKATRANWAKMMGAKDAFEDGRKIFGKQIDDAEIYIEDLIAKGDDEALAAFRAGVASQLRQKSTTGAKLTLFKNLNDLDKKDRLILEKLYPGDALEDALQKIKLAAQAARTEGRVLGGSPTAITLENVKRIGSTSGIANLAQFTATGNPMALVRLITGYLGAASQNLSEAQLARAAQILISEEPNVVRRALKQPAAQKLLGAAIDKIYERLVVGGATSAAISSAKIPPEIPKVGEADVFIGELIKSLSPEGIEKLQDIPQ